MKILSTSKKVLLAVLLVCAFVFLGGVVANAEDGYVMLNTDNDGEWFLHVDSIEDMGSYFTGWVKVKFRDANPEDYAMYLWAMNKYKKQMQLLCFVYYDKHGNVLRSEDTPFSQGKWENCVPGSRGWTIRNEIIAYGRR